jgi:hypothetical protein
LGSAALLGEEFTPADLAIACGRETHDVLAALRAASAAGITQEDRPSPNHRVHSLVRDALADELSSVQRSQLHALIATRFEAAGPRVSPHAADRLAYHFTQAAASDPEFATKAIEHSVSAAEAAERLSAWPEAAAQYKRALELARRDPSVASHEAPIRVALGEAQRSAGIDVEAHRSYREGIDLLRRAGRGTELAQAVLTWLSRTAQYPPTR